MSILTQSAGWIRRSCAGLLTQDCLLCGASSGAPPLLACEADLPQLPLPLSALCSADAAWRSLWPLPGQATALRSDPGRFSL
jgi:hypothetical protein